MRKGRSGSIHFISMKMEPLRKRAGLKTGRSLREPEKPHSREDLLGTMGISEMILAFGQGSLAAGAVAYTFYRSFIAFAIFMVPACIYPRLYERAWRQKRRRYLETQFKEAIQVMAGALGAGYSPENAVAVCSRELELLYGPGEMIVKEFRYMEEQMRLNRSVEQVIQEFADRSGLEEAIRFAGIFGIAKRSGGRLAPVICHTVSVMEDQSQVKEEVRTMTASVQFEQKIMNLIPFCMILFIDFTSPGFFQVMYESFFGRLVMTVCLTVYLLALILAYKIMDVKIL